MSNEKQTTLDVAIVGGGPAGISACLELSRSPELGIALFERESELGGMPRSCCTYFGMRDRKGVYTGPAYARKLNRLVQKTSAQIFTQSTVLSINAGGPGELHQIHIASPQGLQSYKSRFVLLATGCFESSRGNRMIPGTRPAGIFTTGTLQEMVNLYHQKPGKRAVIVGSEHIALAGVLTAKRAGMSIAGMVEEDAELQTYPSLAKAMSFFYRFPVYKGHRIKAVLGPERVEGVELIREKDQKSFQVECDTLIISGRFRPDSSLLDHTPIKRDPSTLGPFVDMNLMTSVPNIFAAGNVLRGAIMHDLCALEGKKAAQEILKRLTLAAAERDGAISIRAESPIRYVVPQKITPGQIKSHIFPKLHPGYSIQLEHTCRSPVLEACSGNETIWKGSFSRAIANHRICLPVEKFDWSKVDMKKEVTLKLHY